MLWRTSAIDSQARKNIRRDQREEGGGVHSCFLVTHNEDACEHLTLHLGHEAQTLLKVAADAVQTQAELRVAAVLAGAASVVAHVQLVAAVGHSGDPEVKLGKERALLCQ